MPRGSINTQNGRLHLHHLVQNDHLVRTTTRPVLCWDYHTKQRYQNNFVDFSSHNVHMYHKPANNIRSMVVHPKDKTPKEHQCGTIYNTTCDNDSSHTYIGETKSFKEHTHTHL